MTNEKAAAPDPIRQITHTARSDSDDVNPLLRQSAVPLPNHDGNYIVIQQKKGQLHNSGAGFHLPVKDRMLNGIVAYFEVSKKMYPFKLQFDKIPSEQSTMQFNVGVEFSLVVIDPKKVVENRVTSLLDCLRLDLKRQVVRIASTHKVDNSRAAQAELQKELDVFACEPWLSWTCHLVTVSPDEQALRKLREIEERKLDIELIATKADKALAVRARSAMDDKTLQTHLENVEEHHIAKLAPLDRLFHDKD